MLRSPAGTRIPSHRSPSTTPNHARAVEAACARGGRGPQSRASVRLTARLAVLLWAVLAVAAPARAEEPERPPSVVLISLDGTRPADVTPESMPTLAGLAERGAVAERLVPVSPSNTFPNHVSLVTGVAPDRHGIVNNAFEDRDGRVFEKSERDIPSWILVEPLWSLLEGAEVRTASFYWVGSEGAWPGGRAPSEWKKFSSRTSEKKKVDQILEWFDRPEDARPRLITAWFHGGDRPGHRDGPGAPSVVRSLRKQDLQIARLLEGLAARGRLADTTVLFVSDHGMTRADAEVDLRAVLRERDGISSRVYGIGGFASVVLRREDRDDEQRLAQVVVRAEELGLEAHLRPQAPPAWRVAHPRFGDVVVRAPIGTAIVYRGLDIEGFHGYDPQLPEMSAVFFALGRGVRPGTRLPALRAVDVAPTVLALLGRPVPEWMEGEVVQAIVPAPPASATLAPAGVAPAGSAPGPR